MMEQIRAFDSKIEFHSRRVFCAKEEFACSKNSLIGNENNMRNLLVLKIV